MAHWFWSGSFQSAFLVYRLDDRRFWINFPKRSTSIRFLGNLFFIKEKQVFLLPSKEFQFVYLSLTISTGNVSESMANLSLFSIQVNSRKSQHEFIEVRRRNEPKDSVEFYRWLFFNQATRKSWRRHFLVSDLFEKKEHFHEENFARFFPSEMKMFDFRDEFRESIFFHSSDRDERRNSICSNDLFLIYFSLFIDHSIKFEMRIFFWHLDSGSMNTPLGQSKSERRKINFIFKIEQKKICFSPLLAEICSQNNEGKPTRWDELRQTVSIVVDIASVFVFLRFVEIFFEFSLFFLVSILTASVRWKFSDTKRENLLSILFFFYSKDIFFLNREPLRNVKTSEELIPVFAVPPSGWLFNKADLRLSSFFQLFTVLIN